MTACVLDTDVVIAALDDRDRHHRRATTAISTMLEAGDSLVLSAINYAEVLVRPAQDERTLASAVDAIGAIGIEVVAPTAAIARGAARHRGLNVSLADGFALATAEARSAAVGSFDRRVRRAAKRLGLPVPEPLR